jgi:MoaA/NifB/PqqE/SkfB family radical SAM enzyme
VTTQVSLGLALTQHCNLRCAHCIRDDVTTVQSLDVELVTELVDQARALFGDVSLSLTGGEPLLHPRFAEIIDQFAERRVPYRFVSNGWHLKRVLPVLERYPPHLVRLSLSGATEAVHDAERGRGSFRRVLLAMALLTSRRIPASLTLVIDRRDRHQLADAAALAEALGACALEFILPQPVEASAARDTDLPPEEWLPVRHEVEVLAAQPGRKTRVVLCYGAPFEGEEQLCDTMQLRRIAVDAWGRLVTCCQLSDYGYNSEEVVADLNRVPLAQALVTYRERMERLRVATRPSGDPLDELDRFPCMRCARECGKLEWLRRYPASPWTRALVSTDAGVSTGSISLPVLSSGSRLRSPCV